MEGERLPFPVGSVAVRQARAATLRAQRAEQQLAAAVTERDALTRQVEELRPPELQQPDRAVGPFFFYLCVWMLACRHWALHTECCKRPIKHTPITQCPHSFPSNKHTFMPCVITVVGQGQIFRT